MATQTLSAANRKLANDCGAMVFSSPVAHVYNPADYARAAMELYFDKYGKGQKRVLFLGMNPGPWGMAQTGIPFGEVNAVRDFLRLDAKVGKPLREHPKRRVDGLACPRSEVSGKRLWGMFARKFGAAEVFFADHFVLNYCPLLFLAASGANITPDKLAKNESAKLFAACDVFLRAAVEVLRPQYLIGIGAFAENRLRLLFDNNKTRGINNKQTRRIISKTTGEVINEKDGGVINEKAGEVVNKKAGDFIIGKILHPSPASPAANRNFAEVAEQQLIDIGVW